MGAIDGLRGDSKEQGRCDSPIRERTGTAEKAIEKESKRESQDSIAQSMIATKRA